MKSVSIFLFILITALTCKPIKAQTGCEGKSEALETIGAFSAATMYNTFQAIGAIVDGNSKKVYDNEKAAQLMDEQMCVMKALDSTLTDLLGGGFITDTNDITWIKSTQTTLKYLHDEAYYFKQYLKTGVQSDLDNYNNYRDKAWKNISDLLGLED